MKPARIILFAATANDLFRNHDSSDRRFSANIAGLSPPDRRLARLFGYSAVVEWQNRIRCRSGIGGLPGFLDAAPWF
jgi:hypothetical protein